MIGQRIGQYQLVRLLGEGGMGIVYEAVQPDLGRRVAIKVLRAEYAAHPQVARRFRNEARAVHIVRHPGLVDIYELGCLDEGGAFIVMEYLEGEPLGRRLHRMGAMALRDAIRVARQIASPLAAAHARAVVHRDLKPENVMIVADPEVPGGERIKVLDFGIAKLLDDQSGLQPEARTRTGMVIGTPRYMAPEQCHGGGAVDAAVDVYALGVVLFEMLTGTPPFMGAAGAEVMMQHMRQAPPSLLAARPDVPPALVALVEAMLAKTPAARPEMSQVAVALEHFGAPVTAGMGTVAWGNGLDRPAYASTLRDAAGERAPTTPPGRARAWVPPLAVAGVALLALLVGLGSWLREPRSVQERRAASGAVNVTADLGPAAPADLGAPVVHWTIDSIPRGAAIINGAELVGRTPFVLVPQAGAPITYRLELPGYRTETATLDPRRNEQRTIVLGHLTKQAKPEKKHDEDPRPAL